MAETYKFQLTIKSHPSTSYSGNNPRFSVSPQSFIPKDDSDPKAHRLHFSLNKIIKATNDHSQEILIFLLFLLLLQSSFILLWSDGMQGLISTFYIF
jgi:hypothetical protein